MLCNIARKLIKTTWSEVALELTRTELLTRSVPDPTPQDSSLCLLKKKEDITSGQQHVLGCRGNVDQKLRKMQPGRCDQ